MIKKTNRKKVIHCNLNDIYMSVAFNKGIVVVLHAPKSCSHIVYNALLDSRRRIALRYHKKLPALNDNLFVTGISDKETIFGGEKLLKNTLEEIIKEKNPECIIVISGCVAGVIGDDVQSVCTNTEALSGIPVIHIPGAGFMSNQQQEGILLTTKFLYEKFADNNIRKNNKSALIFGINKLYLLPQYIEEIKRLYNYFNIDTIMLPPANMTLKEIKTIGSAGIVGINAIISSKLEEYKKFAESFAVKLKIPAIESRLPLTINETLVYLRELGEKLNMQETADYAILSEIRRLEKKINELRVYLSGKNCILAISHSIKFWNPMEFLHLLQDVGIKIKYIILLEELTVKECEEYKIFFAKHRLDVKIIYEKEASILSFTDSVVITTDYRGFFQRQYCIKRKRIGIGGTIRLLERLNILFQENRSLMNE